MATLPSARASANRGAEAAAEGPPLARLANGRARAAGAAPAAASPRGRAMAVGGGGWEGGKLPSGPRAEPGWGRPPPARCLLAAPRGERSEGWAVLQTFYLRTHNSLQLTSPFWGCSRFLPFKEAFRDPFRDPAHKKQLMLSRRPGHFRTFYSVNPHQGSQRPEVPGTH